VDLRAEMPVVQLMQERHQIDTHQLGADPDRPHHLRHPGKGIADEYGGEQHRQVQPKQHPEYDAGHKMHGQGSGRNKSDKQTECECAGDAVPVKRPVSAVEHQRLERPQTPEFLQRMAVRCNAFQPALHG
jgi:hypothetical protein